VSEIFPMETRAMAIAFFYAIGTAVGGITGPLLFGKLIATEHETPVFWGFMLGAVLMIGGGLVQAIWGVAAEQRSLEDVAKPLTAQEAEEHGPSDDDEDRTGAGRFQRGGGRTRALAGAGRRSFGPYESQTLWSPSQAISTRSGEDTDIDTETETLVRVLAEHGPQSRRDLGSLARCKSWGPGRFGRALRIAEARGQIRRDGRGRYST